jgi:hypothetical protein
MSIAVQISPCRETKPGFDAARLHDAIVLLAGGCKSPKQRELAAGQVLEQLRYLARARTISRLLSKPGYRACGDDLIEDAIQHTAIAVCSGAGQFRGSSPAMAAAWCLRILKNYARSEVRRRAPRTLSSPEARRLAEGAAYEGAAYEGVLWHAAAQEAHVTLAALDAQVRSHLRQTRSRRAAESLYRAVFSYVIELTGGRDRASSAVPSARHDRDERRRARARTYQHHHRARCVLAEMREAFELGLSMSLGPPPASLR